MRAVHRHNVGLELEKARALFGRLGHEARESAAFAYFDAEWRMLGMRHTPSASLIEAEVPIRAVATDALALDAVAVVMAHNHPSGDPAPSAADLAITRRLARSLEALQIRLVEHFVLAGDRFTSLRAAGVL